MTVASRFALQKLLPTNRFRLERPCDGSRWADLMTQGPSPRHWFRPSGPYAPAPSGRSSCSEVSRVLAFLRHAPGHSRGTDSRNQADLGGHGRTPRHTNELTRTPADPTGYSRDATDTVRDRASQRGRALDSQADSHSVGHWQSSANMGGSSLVIFHLARTSVDVGGRQKRGLQNRLRSSADVRSSSRSSASVRCRRG
jgi:hypothetical protein